MSGLMPIHPFTNTNKVNCFGSDMPPGATIYLTISYSSSIYGYPEVWDYVKDRISEQYSLLRPDALAYPMLAQASYKSLK
ncbi:MAG: hypothetical protein AB1489_14415 [Acidobacteriota bacterium]